MNSRIKGITVTAQNAPCGAVVRDIDLAQPLSPQQVADIRQAWLAHQVLVFPE